MNFTISLMGVLFASLLAYGLFAKTTSATRRNVLLAAALLAVVTLVVILVDVTRT